jgi:glycosyltransferase involved in cell wall biosynthesis
VTLRHRIYVDLQAAQSTAHAERGIARYSIELTRAMLRHGAPIDAVALHPHLPNPRRLPIDLAASPLLTWRTAASLARVAARGPIAYQLSSPIELEPSPFRALSEAALERADAFVAVVYDLIPLVFADRYLPHPGIREPYLARLATLRDADLLLAISEHTRRDVIERLEVPPERVVTIGGGVSDFFAPAAPGDDPTAVVRARLRQVDRPYVLMVSGWEWRKNTEVLIRAFAALPPDVRDGLQLVLACALPPEGRAAWRDHARRAGLPDAQVVLTGYVDDELLRALYQATDLSVYPSHYEGYGLPVAEAARCGAPVITADTSSLPEILELPASTFPPDDEDALTSLMARALTDRDLRTTLFAASARAATKQTWDHAGLRAIDAYERLDPPAPRRRAHRTRVAFVGPLPPTESGIAIYNERVLDALDANDLEVHVFVEGSAPVERPGDHRVYPLAALDGQLDPYDYDVFLYTIGNSQFHVRSFDLARRHPGIVWLHDAYLIGLHLEWALWLIRSGQRRTDVLTIFREEIRRLYGERLDPALVLVEPLSHHAFVDRSVFLNAGLVREARHLVCNSHLALDMARIDAGPHGRLPPTTVLHHAVPSLDVLPLPAVADPRARRLVVALGIVHAIKRPDVLVRAIAALADPVDLAFVGPCDDEARVLIDAAVRATDLHDRVTITGFVDVADYARWIRNASCAVQLRDVSFGESSGAVHDAIAAGVPVVSSILACADLPPGVVEMVTPDATVHELAAAIAVVLRDASGSHERRDAARQFASEWTFDRVASEIAEVVRRTVRSGG